MGRRKHAPDRELFEELNVYRKTGIPLWLDGRPSSPEEICRAHRVAEDISYMRDYVRDAGGRLTKLEFDAVREGLTAGDGGRQRRADADGFLRGGQEKETT